jgi:hypothetical protein
MRPVFRTIKEKGVYVCANGDRLTSASPIKNIVKKKKIHC